MYRYVITLVLLLPLQVQSQTFIIKSAFSIKKAEEVSAHTKKDAYASAYERVLKGERLAVFAGVPLPKGTSDTLGGVVGNVHLKSIPGKPSGVYDWWLKDGEPVMMLVEDQIKQSPGYKAMIAEEAKSNNPFSQSNEVQDSRPIMQGITAHHVAGAYSSLAGGIQTGRTRTYAPAMVLPGGITTRICRG